MKLFNSRLAWLMLMLRPFWSFWGLFLCSKLRYNCLSPRTILVLDLHLIGDIILLVPFLRVLRDAYPSARIILVAGPWSKEILFGEGIIDEIIPFSAPWVRYGQGFRGILATLCLIRTLRKQKWDMGIEIRGDIRQILLLALAGAKRRVGFDFTGGGALLTDIVPDNGRLVHLAAHHQRIAEYLNIWPAGMEYLPYLRLTEEEAEQAREIPVYVGIHIGASISLRRFSQDDSIKLINQVGKLTNLPIILFSGNEKANSNREIIDSLDEPLKRRIREWNGSLRYFIVTVSRSSYFFCMDSGPAHIVAALDIPETVFFGPNKPEYVKPLGRNIRIIENNEVDCRPCNQKKCTNKLGRICMYGLIEKVKVI